MSSASKQYCGTLPDWSVTAALLLSQGPQKDTGGFLMADAFIAYLLANKCGHFVASIHNKAEEGEVLQRVTSGVFWLCVCVRGWLWCVLVCAHAYMFVGKGAELH